MISLRRTLAAPYALFISATVATVLSLFFAHGLSAQSPADNITIAVSPQSIDIAINPGQATTNIFRLTNDSEQPIIVKPTPKNFIPKGNEGAIEIAEEDTPYSLANWIQVTPSGDTTVEPGQTADFEVVISVPENADPGGHFGSVVFQTIPQQRQDSAAAVSQEVATVILVRVPGDVTEELAIKSVKAFGSPIFASNTPITIEAVVENFGNVHLKPTGTVSVTNVFGKQVDNMEIESNNVIPGAERKMNAAWEDPGFRFGPYTARITMVYGKDNQIITAQTTFWVIPLKQTIPTIIALVVAVYFLYKGRRRLVLAGKALAGKTGAK